MNENKRYGIFQKPMNPHFHKVRMHSGFISVAGGNCFQNFNPRIRHQNRSRGMKSRRIAKNVHRPSQNKPQNELKPCRNFVWHHQNEQNIKQRRNSERADVYIMKHHNLYQNRQQVSQKQSRIYPEIHYCTNFDSKPSNSNCSFCIRFSIISTLLRLFKSFKNVTLIL